MRNFHLRSHRRRSSKIRSHHSSRPRHSKINHSRTNHPHQRNTTTTVACATTSSFRTRKPSLLTSPRNIKLWRRSSWCPLTALTRWMSLPWTARAPACWSSMRIRWKWWNAARRRSAMTPTTCYVTVPYGNAVFASLNGSPNNPWRNI